MRLHDYAWLYAYLVKSLGVTCLRTWAYNHRIPELRWKFLHQQFGSLVMRDISRWKRDAILHLRNSHWEFRLNSRCLCTSPKEKASWQGSKCHLCAKFRRTGDIKGGGKKKTKRRTRNEFSALTWSVRATEQGVNEVGGRGCYTKTINNRAVNRDIQYFRIKQVRGAFFRGRTIADVREWEKFVRSLLKTEINSH